MLNQGPSPEGRLTFLFQANTHQENREGTYDIWSVHSGLFEAGNSSIYLTLRKVINRPHFSRLFYRENDGTQ